MLRSLYNWTMDLAGRKSATWWLALVAFVESSVFVVPADVLFLPMALAKPHRAYRYAFLATLFSVLGGIAGWFLGRYVFDAIARPILQFYGKIDAFEAMRSSVDMEALVLLLVTSGLAHVPPMKVVTILSGAANVSLGMFIASAVITRGARFFILAAVLRRHGESVRHFIEKRVGLIAAVGAAALILLYGVYVLAK
ncbi:membrane protein [Ensifer adhaerens]|uniref:Membrane protein n=1 Tax=Ensifer adhaerens TaxID=106592 RepID=A0A0L8BKW3_ENSAD|nr:YqaA family protein [Ensifer adhaerens]KOF15316.1 membrane protein [Ensifer adhaerens]